MQQLTVIVNYLFSVLFCLLMPFACAFAQDDSVCAVVKIEIKQELTLERQAFDANMIISNGLDDIALENVGIAVQFTDETGNGVLASSDPNNTDAKFFIRVDSMDGIDNIDGSGYIAPASTADIHWLIIPAPGAADVPTGKLYFVGATLNYTFGGEAETVEVIPDSILVKPLPLLTLDYFLERDVYADDAFTPEIEPAEPFTLGVRVQNNGLAVAQNVKIDSAQPEIVENEQGLLIGFQIISSNVNDQPVAPTLLVDLGQIQPQRASIGRWQMLTTLSGEFTEFTAEFTHADELGGELTSLLEATNTHFLVKDILVDLPGRDGVLDFLADDGDALRVYESDSVESVVEDLSSSATFSYVSQAGVDQHYTLSTPTTADLYHIKLTDPTNGSAEIKHVIRSDGKTLPKANAWFSKQRDADNNWDYYINLFDINSTGSYNIILNDKAAIPVPPVLQFIADKTVNVGQQISFLVEASDANGTTPSITADPLPAGAVFFQDTTATPPIARYIFDWVPTAEQVGVYEITYTATDGILSATRKAFITVTINTDSDGDGLDDQWELDNFGTLERDGSGDFDGDGISDLDEFLNGTDPTVGNGPSTPVIESPLFDAEITSLQPVLTVVNSTVTPPGPLTYDFEVYADAQLTNVVASATGIAEGVGLTTAWQVPENLLENTVYYWRVRAFNGALYSLWANGQFFVNSIEEPPAAFAIVLPVDGGSVDSVTPLLSIMNSVDPDGDAIVYQFAVFTDSGLTNMLAASADIPANTTGVTEWVVEIPLLENAMYYWQASAIDEHGLTTTTEAASFWVNTQNDPPTPPVIYSPADTAEIDTSDIDLVVNNAIDPDSFALSYRFELDTVASFDSPNLQQSPLIVETLGMTSWSVGGLLEDTVYYWRVQATDGEAESAWTTASFFVNTLNAAPTVPTVLNPGDGAWVATLTPTLTINPAMDPDLDPIIYHYELYADADLTTLVDQFSGADLQWMLLTPLMDNSWYYWRVRSEDDAGAVSAWSMLYRFFVDDNGVNDAPSLVFVEPVVDTTVTGDIFRIRWTDEDPDSSATIALYYTTDATPDEGSLIVADLAEDDDTAGDYYDWDTTQLAAGIYNIYAVIADELSSSTVYAPGSVTLAPAVGPVETVTLTTDLPSPQLDGMQVTLTATATGGSGDYEYLFRYRNRAISDDWVILQTYSANNSVVWDSTGLLGENTLQVFARTVDVPDVEVKQSQDFYINSVPPLESVDLILSLPSPQLVGTVVTLTGQANGGSGDYEYSFRYNGPTTNNKWVVLQDYAFNNTVDWDTTGLVGENRIQVFARTAGTEDSAVSKTKKFFVNAVEPPTAVSLETSVESPQLNGTIIVLTALATGGSSDYEYQFEYKGPSTDNDWLTLQEYAANNVFAWDTTAALGDNTLRVLARAVGAGTLDLTVKETKKFYINSDAPVTGVKLTASASSPQLEGTVVTWTAEASGGTGSYEYLFRYKGPSTSKEWVVLQEYNVNNILHWDTSGALGSNKIEVQARTAGSQDQAVKQSKNFIVNGLDAMTGVTISADLPSPQVQNVVVTFTAVGQGVTGSYEYLFRYKGPATNDKWVTLQDYSTVNTFIWDTQQDLLGDYRFQVRARNLNSVDTDVIANINFTIE